jgi:hypothetical protein
MATAIRRTEEEMKAMMPNKVIPPIGSDTEEPTWQQIQLSKNFKMFLKFQMSPACLRAAPHRTATLSRREGRRERERSVSITKGQQYNERLR